MFFNVIIIILVVVVLLRLDNLNVINISVF